MALAVNELQDQCPGARVVYCSATGASSLPNLAYMSRLGAPRCCCCLCVARGYECASCCCCPLVVARVVVVVVYTWCCSPAGLWGEGTAFATFTEFYSALDEGGVGAMELIALDMKRRGMYISRQLSFKTAHYETKVGATAPPTEEDAPHPPRPPH